LTGSLLKACSQELISDGLGEGQISVYEVPGALEIPITCEIILKQKKADIIIALGVIIKDDTYHFELIALECARGCMGVSLKYGVPIIFEVLATYNLAQAKKRASGENNKGREAASAALKMLEVIAKI